MSLYKDPITDILGSINTTSLVQLIREQYTYSAPTVVTPDASGTNTSLTITSKDVNSTYDGAVTIRYKRRNLADLVTLTKPGLLASGITDTWKFAQRLNQLYGTGFLLSDVVTSPVNLTNGAGDVTLVAAEGSLGWVGQVTFTVTAGGYDLTTSITNTDLPGLYYPETDTTKPFAVFYSYWRDMSDQYTGLHAVTVDGADRFTLLQAALAANTGDSWIVTGNGRYSLDGATVAYVGAASGHPRLNPAYQFGIVVTLSATASLGLTGDLCLHFNAPVED
jgi:hypothetical protein